MTAAYSVEKPARTARKHIVEKWLARYPSYGITVDNGAPIDLHKGGKAWARITVVPGDTQQVSMGDTRRFRDMGVVIVQLFVKENEGTAELEEMASFIRETLQGQSIEGVVFKNTAIVRAGSSGSWMQFNAVTGFSFDYFV